MRRVVLLYLLIALLTTLFGFSTAFTQHEPQTSVPFIELIQPDWGYIYDIAFHPDGSWLAVAADNGLHLLDNRLQVIAPLQGHSDAVLSVSWSADGSRLASGGADSTIFVWDMVEVSPTYLQVVSTIQESGTVHTVSFSPVEVANQLAVRTEIRRLQASASMLIQTDVRIWDISTGELVHTLGNISYAAGELVWSSDGVFLASAGDKGEGQQLVVWIVESGLIAFESQPQNDRITGIAWQPYTHNIAASDVTGVTLLYDIDDESDVSSWGYEAGTGQIRSVDWSPDGEQFAVGSYFGTLLIYEANTVQTAQLLLQYPLAEPVRTLDWANANPSLIALTTGDYGIRMFDVSTLQQ